MYPVEGYETAVPNIVYYKMGFYRVSLPKDITSIGWFSIYKGTIMIKGLFCKVEFFTYNLAHV